MKTKLSLLFLSYLRFFAWLQLQKIKLLNPGLKIVGITGSAGKTSTVLACEAALKPNFKIKTTSGSNSESGISLNILGLKTIDYTLPDWIRLAILAPIQLFLYWPKFNLYLVEMGIDAATPPKNMDFLLSVIHPDIGIFLNVSPVHLQGFSSLDQIAAEKAKLVNAASLAIINPADPLVVKYTHNQNTVPIKPITVNFKRYLLPDIYQTSFGAAVALAQTLGVDQKTATNNLHFHFHLPPSRASVLKGIKSLTIIDSSYNSSPLACQEMLKFLSAFKSPKIAVLGDMREIGPNSSKYHQELYQTASNIADILISVGPETKKSFGPKAVKFLYWWQATDYLKAHLPLNTTILIKGSQNTIYLEELVKSLLFNPKDSHLLCRQSPYWLKTKEKFRKAIL